jgi:hypothetical protein
VTNGGDNDDGLYDDKSINGGEGLKLCECWDTVEEVVLEEAVVVVVEWRVFAFFKVL